MDKNILLRASDIETACQDRKKGLYSDSEFETLVCQLARRLLAADQFKREQELADLTQESLV